MIVVVGAGLAGLQTVVALRAQGYVGRLTLLESIRCVRLVLWDEGRQRLVSFREMRRNCARLEGDAERRSNP